MSVKKKNRYRTIFDPNAGQPLGPFDRSLCFNCFRPWVESIEKQRETDPKKALDAFLVLAHYCLYGEEPDPDPSKNPWGMAWPAIKQGADSSIKNRSRRFGTEDIDKHELIRLYYLEHQGSTQREIAAATGCSLGLVNKVLQRLDNTGVPGVCSIDYNSNSNPRVPVLEQKPVPDDDDPVLEEVLGPHQPDAQPKEAKI